MVRRTIFLGLLGLGQWQAPAGCPGPHSTISINRASLTARLIQLTDEIISSRVSDPNASVKVSLEISAEFPNGVKDNVKRAITENAQTLGLKLPDWEMCITGVQ